MTHQQQLEIGAYLLGALPPRERSGFEEHLAACAACRNEVADLAGIPTLLGKVSLSDVVAAPPASAPDLPRIETRPDPVPAPAPAAPGDSRTVTLLPTVAGMHGSLVIAGSGTGSVLRLSMGACARDSSAACSSAVVTEPATRSRSGPRATTATSKWPPTRRCSPQASGGWA